MTGRAERKQSTGEPGMDPSVVLTVEQALEQLRAGRQIILVDDEDRENEGDLCMVAEKVTADAVNFMARHGRGLVCLTLTGERVRTLGLRPMTDRNRSHFGTNFHVSIEAREGVSTGISAADRARTVQAAVTPDAGPESVVSPGHVFPIKAVDGGVLVRCGQTEGSVDLARLAGFEPAGVICEIMKDDGTMARRPDLELFAREHGLGILTIAQLIEYRLQRETQVRQVAQTMVVPRGLTQTFKLRLFGCETSERQYLAFVLGDLNPRNPALVRIHRASLINDVFDVAGGSEASKNREALARIEREGAGVFVYAVPERFDLDAQIKRFDEARTFEAAEAEARFPDLREFGLGAQVLRALGVSRIRLMTDNPRRIVGLAGYGLEVVETVPVRTASRG